MPTQNFSPGNTQNGYVYNTTTDCDGIPIAEFWTDEITSPFIRADSESSGAAPHTRRGYAFFDLSAFSFAGKTVTKVEFFLYCKDTQGINTLLKQQATQKSGYGTAEALFNGLDDGATYVSYLAANNTGTTSDLGATAITDLDSHNTWFGVGIISSNEANTTPSRFYSTRTPSDTPYLIVTYTEGRRRSSVVFT